MSVSRGLGRQYGQDEHTGVEFPAKLPGSLVLLGSFLFSSGLVARTARAFGQLLTTIDEFRASQKSYSGPRCDAPERQRDFCEALDGFRGARLRCGAGVQWHSTRPHLPFSQHRARGEELLQQASWIGARLPELLPKGETAQGSLTGALRPATFQPLFRNLTCFQDARLG